MVFFIFICLFLLLSAGLAYVVFNRARPGNANPGASDYTGPENSTLSSWNSVDSSNPWHSGMPNSASSESADLSCNDFASSDSDPGSDSGSCDSSSDSSSSD